MDFLAKLSDRLPVPVQVPLNIPAKIPRLLRAGEDTARPEGMEVIMLAHT